MALKFPEDYAHDYNSLMGGYSGPEKGRSKAVQDAMGLTDAEFKVLQEQHSQDQADAAPGHPTAVVQNIDGNPISNPDLAPSNNDPAVTTNGNDVPAAAQAVNAAGNKQADNVVANDKAVDVAPAAKSDAVNAPVADVKVQGVPIDQGKDPVK